jgi:hypothetical protein
MVSTIHVPMHSDEEARSYFGLTSQAPRGRALSSPTEAHRRVCKKFSFLGLFLSGVGYWPK